jgi:hypothetical protein
MGRVDPKLNSLLEFAQVVDKELKERDKRKQRWFAKDPVKAQAMANAYSNKKNLKVPLYEKKTFASTERFAPASSSSSSS